MPWELFIWPQSAGTHPNRLNYCCLTVSSHLMSAGATASLEWEYPHLKVVSITSGTSQKKDRWEKVSQLFIEWINHLVYNFGTTLVTCRLGRRTMKGEKKSRPALLTGSHQFYYSFPLLWCLALTSHMPSVNPHTKKEIEMQIYQPD